ncbi:ferredoxin family protein [Nocardia salmonicida]|uniref:ferredoxin family protein n=1 Tax=Nocardia TaxID=1817 RepID=UPI00265B4633|nr:ferredoxin family protein [Nocardia sp. PE-7]WKG12245.1 ferredoxin family protein [Nocardia sp. PE-7]
MIELLRAQDCIGCDKCVTACPTNVFDRVDGGIPVIARQSDCQTCFMCEAYCPTDALYVAPEVTPLPPDAAVPTEHIGRYREKLGWGHGRTAGARVAVGPRLPHGAPPPRLNP